MGITEEARDEILTALDILRCACIKNHVSIALSIEDKNIYFFDTNTYIKEKKFTGFSVNADNLVK